jgi:flagellar motor switch/type III secretory pathway protein FliN
MSRVRPFPWATLDAMSRADLTVSRGLARLFGGAERLSASARALAEIVACPCSIRLRAVEPVASPPEEGALAIAIAIDDATIAIEVEPSLAIEIVARAAGRAPRTPLVLDDPSALAPAASALGALLVKALRRGRGDAVVRVVSSGPASSVLAAIAPADPSAAIYTLLMEADAFRGRVIFSRRLAGAAPDPSLDRAALAALGAVRLSVPVVAAASWTTARELSALQVGDAWMPADGRSLAESLTLRSGAALVVAGARADRGLAATLEDGGRLVLGRASEELTMTDAAEDTILESALDAPVVVRVEVGSVELSAREWASLAPGDVVTLDRRVGTPVLLRAGGAELGQGELVDVDGELGVRIVSLGASA